VRFYSTGTEILYDYNANLSKAVGAKRLPLTILCKGCTTKASTRDLACPIPEGQLLANLHTVSCTVFQCLHIYIECGISEGE